MSTNITLTQHSSLAAPVQPEMVVVSGCFTPEASLLQHNVVMVSSPALINRGA